MKKMNKKGFTLAELLIVVAIIAVLVAIAIPVFTSQLAKSREATDMANIRAAYAEAAVAAIDSESSSGSKTSVPMVHTGTFSNVENTIVGGSNIASFSVTKGKGVVVTVSDTGATFSVEP